MRQRHVQRGFTGSSYDGRTVSRAALRTIAALSLTLVWGLSRAQDSEPYEADPPERAARLSHIEGEVSLQPAGEEAWAPALLNRPLTTGDRLWTEPGSRAEISVGRADVRLDSNTGFSFLNVDDHVIQMRLTAGVINVSVRALEGNEHIEIDTPNVAVSLLRTGNYRVEVNDAGDSTVVKVAEGAAEVNGRSQNVIVHGQQVVTFNGTENLVAQFNTLGEPDEFDSWSLDRDRLDERAASSRTAEYVSPDVTGYEDLEDNGSWSSEPEYGHVWTPRYVGADWAPYRYGRWVSVAPWGWTWIDDTRWGYAPFHYGRWARIRHRWCWVPGPRHVRPVYAPALVGWIGPPGVRVSWFPLAPREVYAPGRRFSRRYLERVNVANTVIVNRSHIADVHENRTTNFRYRHREPDAVTAAERTTFATAGRIGEHRVRLSQQELARELATTPVSAAAPRIEPRRESRLGAPARANVRVPPRNIADRPVVVRRAPPPAVARLARNLAADRQAEERPAFDRSAVVRARPDRPRRDDRPASAATPQTPTQTQTQTRTSVFDRDAIAERVRRDGERQVREQRSQREAEQQRRNDQARQRTEQSQSQAPPVQQHQQREFSERVRDAARQNSRQQSAPQTEQREQPAQRARSVERQQVREPQRSTPSSQPRSQPQRSAEPRSSQPRSTQPRSTDNSSSRARRR